MKIITWNLGHGRYNTKYKKGDITSKKQIINNILGQKSILEKFKADIVLLQETGLTKTSNGFINHNKLLKLNSYDYIYYSNRYFPFIINIGNSVLIKKDKLYKVNKITSNYLLKGYKHNYYCQNKNSIRIIINDYAIYNIHLTPYFKNKKQRDKQLMNIIKDAFNLYNQGFKIIIGGDFNMILNEGIHYLDNNIFTLLVPSSNTCRDLRTEFKEDKVFTLDGFIISKNVEVKLVESLFDFRYSDHSPVMLEIEI